MKYLNLKKQFALLALVAFAFSACKKIKTAEPMGDAGQTLVKIVGGGTPAAIVSRPIDFVPTPTKLSVASIRRDVPNNTELNRTMIVTVKDDTAAVRAANPAYKQLPTAWYTLQIDGVKTGGQGGTFTFTFKPGEFAKEIFVTIPNATLLDPSSLYGLGFTITTADANGIISSEKSVVIEIGAKNQYDGRYSLDVFESGWAAYGISDGTTNTYPGDMLLITTGAATNAVFNDYTGTFLLAGFAFPLSATQFGATTPVFTFDPVSNKLLSVTNSTPDDGRGRFLFLDPAYTNSGYDPATKSIFAAFYMTQVGRPNQYFRFYMKYKGPR